MAGDWIKMRIDLQSHPKVVRILSATQSDKFRAIGGLHAVWSVFDIHSVDGILRGYSPKTMDHVIGWEGFSDALIAVNWLEWDGKETLLMPEFTEHNGQSGKRRAEDQKRKKKSRQSVRILSDDDADKKRTREEKRREDSSVAKATGGKPPSKNPVRDEIWAKALPMLQAQFGEKMDVRAYLGKLCKDWGELLVLEAVRDAAQTPPLDAKSWLVARCQERRAQSGNKATALEARNREAVKEALRIAEGANHA